VFAFEGEHSELRLVHRLAELVDEWRSLVRRPVVGVDVPIGLPGTAGLRACDREARALLGRRRMCVFPPPDRGLFGLTFEEARNRVLARRGDLGPSEHPIMSHQSIAIMSKIAEVDGLLRTDASLQDWIVEVHPEVSFRLLATIHGLDLDLPRKKSRTGRTVRRELLGHVFPELESGRWLRSEVGEDDILDAYAACWTALRYARDRASVTRLGGDLDDHGIVRQMLG
jgi:predicted RNase H-like nuclease